MRGDQGESEAPSEVKLALHGPPELDEPVHLVDWSPEWTDHARRVAAELGRQLGERMQIEHIGSTSVAGLAAKPILDLMIGTPLPEEVDHVARLLAGPAWVDMGEAGVPGRRHLRRRGDGAVNLHIGRLGGEHWRNNIALRDFLRTHPEDASLYADLKREIIASGAARLLEYSERKSAFLMSLIARATAAGA